MDKRSYLSKMVEPNELFFQLILDILMYCKYQLLNGANAGSDNNGSGLVDLLRKTKGCLQRILH